MATVTVNDSDVYISSASLTPSTVNTGGSSKIAIGMGDCIPVLGGVTQSTGSNISLINTTPTYKKGVDSYKVSSGVIETSLTKGSSSSLLIYDLNAKSALSGKDIVFTTDIQYDSSDAAKMSKILVQIYRGRYAKSGNTYTWGISGGVLAEEVLDCYGVDEMEVSVRIPTLTSTNNAILIYFYNATNYGEGFPHSPLLYINKLRANVITESSDVSQALADTSGALLRTK